MPCSAPGLHATLAFLALFSSCVLAQTSPAPELGTGLEGVILMGPVHGGPIREGAPDSKPVAHVAFVVTTQNSVVSSFTTDEQGRFRISLPAGHYTISRKDWRSKFGRYGPFQVDIAEGRITKVQWNCDTGMR